MSDPRRDLDDLAIRFHDGLLSPQEQAEIMEEAQTNMDLAAALEREAQLNAMLERVFQPPAPTFQGDSLKEAGKSNQATSGTSETKSAANFNKTKWRVALLALAATVAWVLFGWQWFFQNKDVELAYVQRPLTEVYQTCVEEGFQPYWICDEDEVFAETFRRRQGVALKLPEFPKGSMMAGLSYLAGLSEESTSMLAYVNEKPVIVIIDKQQNDWGPPIGYDEASRLYVFRDQRAGLALYEVSPYAESNLLEYFQPLDAGELNDQDLP